jgi:hypothetical protein
VGGGALVEEIARQRQAEEAVAAQRKTLLVLLVAVGAFGIRGGIRPTEIEAAAGAAASLAMRTARHAHHWWRRNSDTVHDGGCVIIRPQAEVEDEDELPVAFPARGSLDLMKLLT